MLTPITAVLPQGFLNFSPSQRIKVIEQPSVAVGRSYCAFALSHAIDTFASSFSHFG